MSLRSLTSRPGWLDHAAQCALAGPSRVRRRHLTLPHPDLDPSKGSTKLYVRFLKPNPSLLDFYAILRAIEDKLGPTCSIHALKSPDTMRPTGVVYIDLVRPVSLDRDLLLEVPTPRTSPESDQFGGPSMEDVLRILRSERVDDLGDDSKPTIQVRVKLRRPKSEVKEPEITHTNRVTLADSFKEDRAIVDALRQFEGGFFGGFKGLADDFAHLREEPVTVFRNAGLKDSGEDSEEKAGE